MSANSTATEYLNRLSQVISQSSATRNGCFDPNQRSTLKSLLYDSWKTATDQLCKDTALSEVWFERLWQMHTDDARHYHTVVHLDEMIHFFQLLRDEGYPTSMSLDRARTILLAIFFHDAIYNVKSASNEEDSAILFEEFAFAADFSETHVELAANVTKYIRATQKHEVSDSNYIDLALFLDLDMAVLGKNEEAYKSYSALIRREYNFVPRDVYCEKRAEILQLFLQQTHIYGTPVFRDAFESQARSNLRKEINALRQGIIFGETTG